LLKERVPREEWVQQLTKMRARLGTVVEREQDEITSSPSLGDLPEGEYVILSYVSKYQAKTRVTETITVALGKESRWQVAGYFVQ
jgi:hypothetical protein